jgi:hypothetical protein
MFPFLNREGIGHIPLPKEEKRKCSGCHVSLGDTNSNFW